MVRPSIGGAIAAALLFSTLSVVTPRAWALSCPEDPDALTFQEMIDQGTTGKDRFPIMFLGVVVAIVDLGGRPDGGR